MKKSLKLIILVLVVILLGIIIWFAFINHDNKPSIDEITVTDGSDMSNYSSGIQNVGSAVFGYTFQGETYLFYYPIGYTVEICDCVAFGHSFTHTGTLEKYGLAYINGGFHKVLYFSGDSDIEGWYLEDVMIYISEFNYADDDRIPGSYVMVLN